MKTNKIYLAISFLACTITSCTKIITINVKETDKKLVVDAEIGSQPKQCIVKLSKTISYAASNNFAGVSGAIVSMSDEAGNNIPLAETTSGIYTNDSAVGKPGAIYTLKIVAEGKNYSSSCKMPSPIKLDSINNSEQILLGNKVKIVQAHFTDNGSETNYYRFYKTINGIRKGESEIADDNFINGVATSARFASFSPRGNDSILFVTGNNFGVTVQNISKAVYVYFNSKAQNTNGQSGAPANPETNIIGGALGYFNAYTSDYKETIIK